MGDDEVGQDEAGLEGSGISGQAEAEVEWSEWSPCSASCGAGSQSRWSRCLDGRGMMDCIQVR